MNDLIPLDEIYAEQPATQKLLDLGSFDVSEAIRTITDVVPIESGDEFAEPVLRDIPDAQWVAEEDPGDD